MEVNKRSSDVELRVFSFVQKTLNIIIRFINKYILEKNLFASMSCLYLKDQKRIRGQRVKKGFGKLKLII